MAAYRAANEWRITPRAWRALSRPEQIELLSVEMRRHHDRMRLLRQVIDRLPTGISELAQIMIFLSEM